MRKILAAVAAAGVLVAGAFTAAAITDTGVAVAQETAEDEATEERPPRWHHGEIIDEVLGQFVPEVLTEAEADAIKQAFEEKAAEMRDEFGDRPFRGRHRPGFADGFRRGFNIGGLLEDGVIDEAELEALGPDHPLNDPEGPAAAYVDGGLTAEELEQIHDELHADRPFGHGRRGPAEETSLDA